MKVVILAGGWKTRLDEGTEYRPKPMLEIDDKPILWHIMKEYSYYGFNDFIICCGYKHYMIKQWFNDYYLHNCDVTFDYTGGKCNVEIHNKNTESWKITCVDTGLDTMTGGRIKRVQEYIGDKTFMLTYGDGVCDVNLIELLEFHRSHGKKATFTSVIQRHEKDLLDISDVGAVRVFREKESVDESPINVGYMVLEPSIFDYLEGDDTILEQKPMERLVNEGELMSYRHKGFWKSIDSARDKMILDSMWKQGKAPWKVWND